jgi:hypothetical protein
MPEHLMGIAEIAELLRVSRTRVHQLRAEGALPDPHDQLAMGPVWLKVDVERWARETGRIK